MTMPSAPERHPDRARSTRFTSRAAAPATASPTTPGATCASGQWGDARRTAAGAGTADAELERGHAGASFRGSRAPSCPSTPRRARTACACGANAPSASGARRSTSSSRSTRTAPRRSRCRCCSTAASSCCGPSWNASTASAPNARCTTSRPGRCTRKSRGLARRVGATAG